MGEIVDPPPGYFQRQVQRAGDAFMDWGSRPIQREPDATLTRDEIEAALAWPELPKDMTPTEHAAARASCEAMGLEIIEDRGGPGTLWEILGGVGPPRDPLEVKIRREMGLE